MKELMAEFAGAIERQSKSNLLLAMSLAFALVSVTSAEGETSTSEEKARVIQVRSPGSQTVAMVGHLSRR